MTVRRTPSSPLPLRERVASGGSREPGEGASSYDSNADTPSPALASLGHPLPQGERGRRSVPHGHRAISQVVPSLESFSTTPLAASSSRMRSDSAKFFAVRAANLSSIFLLSLFI